MLNVFHGNNGHIVNTVNVPIKHAELHSVVQMALFSCTQKSKNFEPNDSSEKTNIFST